MLIVSSARIVLRAVVSRGKLLIDICRWAKRGEQLRARQANHATTTLDSLDPKCAETFK